MGNARDPIEELLRQAREQRGQDDALAILLLEQAVGAARTGGLADLLAEALNGLARLEHERGDSQGALFHFAEALELREASGDTEGTAAVLCNLGSVHLDLGGLNTALDYLLRADVLLQNAPAQRIATVAMTLARTYDALGQEEDAHAQFDRASRYARECRHHAGEAIIAVNQADLLRRQQRYAQAEELLSRVLQFVGRQGALAASALHALGQLRRDEGRITEALAAFREALPLAQAEHDVDAVLDARCGEAEALLDLARPAEALGPLEAAILEAEEGGRARARVRALWLRARAHELRANLPMALESLREAHLAETDVLRAEAARRTRDLQVRGELEQARARLEREQARYEAERDAKEKFAREQAARLAELEQLALYDTLTGLPNRLLLGERARAALEDATARGAPLALGVVDLDKFKGVNDEHGHHVGDLLLQGVAARLGLLFESATVARTGGDEFVFLTREAGDAELRVLAERFARAFDDPFYLEGVELSMRPSVGVARYPHDATDLPGLLEHADHAMYRAKARGSAFEVSARTPGDGPVAPATLEAALHRALSGGELHLAYQPICDVQGRWVAVEALLRWRSALYGNVPPAQFMPLAERSGLSVRLAEWSLERACSDLAALPGLTLAVNVSARQLADPGLPQMVRRALQAADCDPPRLTLEVREDVVARAPERAAAALHALRETGVRLALDDFGGGNANLAQLSQLPLAAVKLDRTLVQGLGTVKGRALLAAVASLGRALDLEVVAKGVETDEQRVWLGGAGIHAMQGFLVSAPLGAEELGERLLRPEAGGTALQRPDAGRW